MAEVAGVVGAMLTPFDADDRPDLEAAAREAEFMAGHCDGVSVLGAGVSEWVMLDADTRRSYLREAIAMLKGRTQVIAGISAPTTGEAIELAELAAEAGADVAQLLMPMRSWGGEPTAAELIRFFEIVAEKSPLPLVAYHHPGLGADPAYKTIIEICTIDGVIALKDSSRNMARNLAAVEDIQQAGHANYLTTIQSWLGVAMAGGAGVMTPAPFSLVGAGIRDAVAARDYEGAAAHERLIVGFPDRWSRFGLMPLSKRAMSIIGIPVGEPAAPYSGVPEAESAEIAEYMQSWFNTIPALASAKED